MIELAMVEHSLPLSVSPHHIIDQISPLSRLKAFRDDLPRYRPLSVHIVIACSRFVLLRGWLSCKLNGSCTKVSHVQASSVAHVDLGVFRCCEELLWYDGSIQTSAGKKSKLKTRFIYRLFNHYTIIVSSDRPASIRRFNYDQMI